MIDPQLILKKLKISKLESIDNILEDERLCRRIITEKPIRVADFLGKKLISTTVLKKLINSRIISQFSNSDQRGSSKYIFENEIEPFLVDNLVYTPGVLKSIEFASRFILEVFEDVLTKREVKILNIYLVEYGNAESLDKFLIEYNLKRAEAYNLFYRTLARIRQRKSLYDLYLKDWIAEKYTLIDEVQILRKLKGSLYERIKKVDVNNNFEVIIEKVDILGKKILDLDLSFRAYYGLHSYRIETVQDLLEFESGDLLIQRNVGPATVNEIRRKLAEYGLRLKNE